MTYKADVPAASGTPMGVYIQYGCGSSCPDGWINFDASPTLRLQQLPVLGRFFRRGTVFPASARYGDIVKGLPVPDNSADGIYASHVLEHLSLADFWLALRNTLRLLKPGGIFRLVVPDLEARARIYLQKLESGEVDANAWLMRSAGIGVERRDRSLEGTARAILGNSAHLWMWDEKSMAAALRKAGFVDVRRCQLNDSTDAAFRLVEEAGRFFDHAAQVSECAMEARKPA
jgi:SAM-dependent methyltransferase